MPAVFNGQRRPNLNDQINRLDRILDGLADGLNEAVATAVRTAVTIAVREATETVLRELLLRAELPAIAPVAPQPSVVARIGRWCKRSCLFLTKHLTPVAVGVCAAWSRLTATGRRLTGMVGRSVIGPVTRRFTPLTAMLAVAAYALWRVRLSVVPASIIGVCTAAGAYLAGPAIASALCGLTVTGLALVSSVVRGPWKRMTVMPCA